MTGKILQGPLCQSL